MPVTLQVFTGSVNFTNYLHVTAAKVSTPTVVAWETWIPEPQSNYNFVIPNLDADIYYITFYNSLTNSSLGVEVSQCEVSALSPEFAHEIIFYTIGDLQPTASLDNTSTILTDTYLIGKTAESFFKEGYRFLQPGKEVGFNIATGSITLLNGTIFNPEEKFTVGVKYAAGSSSGGTTGGTSGGLYAGTATITAAIATLSVSDKNKRIRLQGSNATQVITLPSLLSLSNEDGFYFDNTVGGVAIQPKILFDGSDSIKYNGFFAASDFFQEFWVSKGEHLLIRKFTDGAIAYFEVITDYKGVNVGKRMSAQIANQPGYIPEDFSLLNGDELGRLWWYVNNKLSAMQVLVDDNVINSNYQPTQARIGQFVKHSTLKQFRVGNTQGLSEKGLANFTNYGADGANRPYDYPMAFQPEMVGAHTHPVDTKQGLAKQSGSSTDCWAGNQKGATDPNSGTQNRVDNVGVIYSVHI